MGARSSCLSDWPPPVVAEPLQLAVACLRPGLQSKTSTGESRCGSPTQAAPDLGAAWTLCSVLRPDETSGAADRPPEPRPHPADCARGAGHRKQPSARSLPLQRAPRSIRASRHHITEGLSTRSPLAVESVAPTGKPESKNCRTVACGCLTIAFGASKRKAKVPDLLSTLRLSERHFLSGMRPSGNCARRSSTTGW